MQRPRRRDANAGAEREAPAERVDEKPEITRMADDAVDARR